jgi:hypothetical protein
VSPLKIKIPTKNLVKQCCAEGFNSGVKGLSAELLTLNVVTFTDSLFADVSFDNYCGATLKDNDINKRHRTDDNKKK